MQNPNPYIAWNKPAETLFIALYLLILNIYNPDNTWYHGQGQHTEINVSSPVAVSNNNEHSNSVSIFFDKCPQTENSWKYRRHVTAQIRLLFSSVKQSYELQG